MGRLPSTAARIGKGPVWVATHNTFKALGLKWGGGQKPCYIGNHRYRFRGLLYREHFVDPRGPLISILYMTSMWTIYSTKLIIFIMY